VSQLARGAEAVGVGLGNAFIKDFKIKRAAGAEVAGTLRSELDDLVANSRSMEAQAASIAARVESKLSDDAARELTALREVPGFEEEFLVRSAGADPAQFRVVGSTDDIRDARLRLGFTDEMVETVIDTMPKEQVEALQLMLTGDPAFARLRARLPGTRGSVGEIEDIRRGATEYNGRQEALIDLDHLQVDKIEELFRRTGVAHVGHFTRRRELRNFLEAELRESMGDAAAGITDPNRMLDKARRLLKLNKEAAESLRMRKLVGSIDEIERDLGIDLFVKEAGEEFFQSSKRFIAVKTADDFAKAFLEIPEVAKMSVTKFEPGQVPTGFKVVGLKQFPRSVANRLEKQGIKEIAVNEVVFEEFFGQKGVLNNLFSLGEGTGLLRALQGFNKWYKPWTLAHPATITRDTVGDLALNLVAGVSPTWYGPGSKVMRDLFRFRKGKMSADELGQVYNKKWIDPTTGKPMTKGDVIGELIDSGVPGHSLQHTEFYGQQFEAMKQGKLRRILKADPGQNTYTRGVMRTKGYIADASRITHFLERRFGRGMSTRDAMLSVKKFLYDADNMTNFERRIMREVFPFYSWARQNIPNMVRASVMGTEFNSVLRPNLTAVLGRTKINLDENNRADVPEEILPTWLQGQLTLPVGRNPDGNLSLFALNTWIPVADLTEVDSPKKFVRFAFNSLTPLISEPFEQFFNWDAFFERSIERYEGEREHLLGFALNKRSARIIRNARLINEFDRVVIPMINKQFGTEIGLGSDRLRDLLAQQEFGDLALRGLTGLKVRRVDLVRAKQVMLKRLDRDMRGLKTKLKFARRDNDQVNERQILTLLGQKRDLKRVALGFEPDDHPGISATQEPDIVGR
jgi:hypothetical protein